MSVYANNVQITKSKVLGNRSSTSKYCDVCYGAGKSFAEYTSHFVKSKVGPDGVVTCPTILNSICTYCKGKGHFKSACEVLKAKNAKMDTVPAAPAAMKSKSCIKKRQRNGDVIANNTFDCLRDCCDSESEDDEIPLIIPVQSFESSVMGSGSGIRMSYAQALESAAKTFPAAAGSNVKGKSLMKFLTPTTTATAAASALPPLVALNSSSNEVGHALHAYLTNTVPPLVTLRRSSSAFNANGTRKSWADYDSDDSSEGEDEDEE
jgi:hypothetical protein